jgi:hypothetical protein
MSVIDADRIAALSTAQVAAIDPADITAIPTAAISGFLPDQLSAMSMSQANAFTGFQTLAMTGTQTTALGLASPLILDLDGNGVQTIPLNDGTIPLLTGWVDANDGLLVLDRNNDGQITDGSELFGTATANADGNLAPDGFAALAEFDENGDLMITAADNIFSTLRVWVDANLDAISQPNELKALDSLGIDALHLSSRGGVSFNNGNWVGREGSYMTSDGQVHQMHDVWFRTDDIPMVTETHAAVQAHDTQRDVTLEPSYDESQALQLLIAKDTITTTWP